MNTALKKKFFILIIPAFVFLVFIPACQNREKPPTTFTASIYLSQLDSSQVNKDIAFLKSLPYVLEAKFITKEQMKVEHLDRYGDPDSTLKDRSFYDTYKAKIDFDKFNYDERLGFVDTLKANIKHYSGYNFPTLIHRGRHTEGDGF